MIIQATVSNYRFDHLRLYSDNHGYIYYSLEDLIDCLKLRKVIDGDTLLNSPAFYDEDGNLTVVRFGENPGENLAVDTKGLIELLKLSPRHKIFKKDYLNWILTDALPALNEGVEVTLRKEEADD